MNKSLHVNAPISCKYLPEPNTHEDLEKLAKYALFHGVKSQPLPIIDFNAQYFYYPELVYLQFSQRKVLRGMPWIEFGDLTSVGFSDVLNDTTMECSYFCVKYNLLLDY